MRGLIDAVGGIVVFCAFAVGLAFGGGWLSLEVYRTYATQMEDARTDVYRKNKSYVEGTIRDLRDLKRQYVQSSESQKEALKSIILHRAGEVDWESLPGDVRSFLNELEK